MTTGLEKQRQVGARIRELREPRPQPVVAEAVGVTLRAYHAWEAGESGIAWRNLQKLADFFNVSENYLLYGSEEVKGPESQLDRIEASLSRIEKALAIEPVERQEIAAEMERELEVAAQRAHERGGAVAKASRGPRRKAQAS